MSYKRFFNEHIKHQNAKYQTLDINKLFKHKAKKLKNKTYTLTLAEKVYTFKTINELVKLLQEDGWKIK